MNIKLCDFGWCAEVGPADRTTFCGTYEYMAPEVLFHKPQSMAVDVWALGILLYELLHNKPPLSGRSAKEMAAKARCL